MVSTARPDAGSFVTRLHAAYRRAAPQRGQPRSWTTQQPDGWIDTSTVAALRPLSDERQQVWLRHRTG